MYHLPLHLRSAPVPPSLLRRLSASSSSASRSVSPSLPTEHFAKFLSLLPDSSSAPAATHSRQKQNHAAKQKRALNACMASLSALRASDPSPSPLTNPFLSLSSTSQIIIHAKSHKAVQILGSKQSRIDDATSFLATLQSDVVSLLDAPSALSFPPASAASLVQCFNTFIASASRHGSLYLAEQAFTAIPVDLPGVTPDVVTFNVMAKAYVDAGEFEAALQVFQRLPSFDDHSHSIGISIAAGLRDTMAAEGLLEQMDARMRANEARESGGGAALYLGWKHYISCLAAVQEVVSDAPARPVKPVSEGECSLRFLRPRRRSSLLPNLEYRRNGPARQRDPTRQVRLPAHHGHHRRGHPRLLLPRFHRPPARAPELVLSLRHSGGGLRLAHCVQQPPLPLPRAALQAVPPVLLPAEAAVPPGVLRRGPGYARRRRRLQERGQQLRPARLRQVRASSERQQQASAKEQR